MRRYPNGKLETLADMDFSVDHPATWWVDQRGHIIFQENDKIRVKDMVTGQIIAPASAAQNSSISPDGRWIVQSDRNATIHISKTR
jgi:hypothetical protein